MGKIVDIYTNGFLQRFNYDPAVPYYNCTDFEGLHQEKYSFLNDLSVRIAYFAYYYDGHRTDKVIFFCPGIGPGHRSYLAEIEALCRHGFKVFTIDYMGCGESGGDDLFSINQPYTDVINLLDQLAFREELIIVGHSLGAYTALSTINKMSTVHKAIIISGFLSITNEVIGFAKLHFLAKMILKHEERINPKYSHPHNWDYLKNANDKLLFIHSKDDPIVNYRYNTKRVQRIKNPNLSFYICNGKKHNPTYTKEAANNSLKLMDTYNKKVANGSFKSEEDKINYFKDVSLAKLTEQDQEVLKIIFDYIDKE